MLPRLKFMLIAAMFMGFLSAVSPALADPVDGVIGSGTPASCTSAAALSDLQAEINDGGLITFNCGASPVTIPITTILEAGA